MLTAAALSIKCLVHRIRADGYQTMLKIPLIPNIFLLSQEHLQAIRILLFNVPFIAFRPIPYEFQASPDKRRPPPTGISFGTNA